MPFADLGACGLPHRLVPRYHLAVKLPPLPTKLDKTRVTVDIMALLVGGVLWSPLVALPVYLGDSPTEFGLR